jgi:histidinol-phosphate aminotransferase
LAALDDCEHVKRSLDVNRQGLAYLRKEFERLGLPFVPSHGNFILVASAKASRFSQPTASARRNRPPLWAVTNCPSTSGVTVGTMDENREIYRSIGESDPKFVSKIWTEIYRDGDV